MKDPASAPLARAADYLLGMEQNQLVLVPVADGLPVGQNQATGALMAGGSAVLNLENTGTAASPVWDLRATVLPRTGTQAALSALTSGGGELCSATDTEAIVQLRGTGPGGTALVFGRVPPGMWNNDQQAIQNPTGVTSLVIEAREGASNGGSAANVVVSGGFGDAGNGGNATITGGASASGNGGNVLLQSGDCDFGGNTGDVEIIGLYNPSAGGGGNVFMKAAGTLALRTSGNTNVVQINGSSGALGFFNSAGTTKPAVSGSRGGNAALASLLTALANMGLITNSTSA